MCCANHEKDPGATGLQSYDPRSRCPAHEFENHQALVAWGRCAGHRALLQECWEVACSDGCVLYCSQLVVGSFQAVGASQCCPAGYMKGSAVDVSSALL